MYVRVLLLFVTAICVYGRTVRNKQIGEGGGPADGTTYESKKQFGPVKETPISGYKHMKQSMKNYMKTTHAAQGTNPHPYFFQTPDLGADALFHNTDATAGNNRTEVVGKHIIMDSEVPTIYQFMPGLVNFKCNDCTYGLSKHQREHVNKMEREMIERHEKTMREERKEIERFKKTRKERERETH